MEIIQSRKGNRKRQHRIGFWLNDEEYQNLNLLVSKTTMSREAVIRALLTGLTIKERPPAEYGAIVVQLRMIGNNLNQLTALFHKHGFPNVPELKKISQDVHRMNQLFIDSFSQE